MKKFHVFLLDLALEPDADADCFVFSAAIAFDVDTVLDFLSGIKLK